MQSKLFSVVRLLTVGAALTLSNAAFGQAKPAPGRPDTVKRPVAQKVTLKCDNPGSHQDVSKTPIITNTTSQTLNKGRKVFWSSSDGDKGTIELDKSLAPNGNVQGLGNPGQSYSCQAWILN